MVRVGGLMYTVELDIRGNLKELATRYFGLRVMSEEKKCFKKAVACQNCPGFECSKLRTNREVLPFIPRNPRIRNFVRPSSLLIREYLWYKNGMIKYYIATCFVTILPVGAKFF